MANFVLAANPIRPWNTLLSSPGQFALRGSSDGSFVIDRSVSGLRGYMAVLDRLPDAGGLANWTAARKAAWPTAT